MKTQPLTNDPPAYDYERACSRTLGWVTRQELERLRRSRIAIAGLGGVGGSHLITLARLGVGRFTLAEMDDFEIGNMNRQAGAFCSTLGQPKLAVARRMARDINPELDLHEFPDGIAEADVGAFLEGVDLYVDSLDFFQLPVRRAVFAACRARGIPAITAAPLGMGTAVLVFTPTSMSFDDYFGLDAEQDEEEQYLRFLVGLSPRMMQMRYLVDPSRVDLEARRGPSTPMACELCAGVAGTLALKLLLGRGPVTAAPQGLQFDAYRQRFVRTHRRGGNRGNPLQRLTLNLARRQFQRRKEEAAALADSYHGDDPIVKILDLARWAPSGDNSQPWRFERTGKNTVRVRIAIDRDNPYEYNNGQPTVLSGGFLLETMSIAASRYGRSLDWCLEAVEDDEIRIHVVLPQIDGVTEDPLCDQIKTRSVDRRPYRPTPLTAGHITKLEDALGPYLQAIWLTSLRERWQCARLNSAASHIRLSMPETYPIHRDLIHWHERFDKKGIPADAIGVDPLLKRVMRWAMQSQSRLDFMNRYLMGTLAPRMQLDLLPGLFSAGFCLIRHQDPAFRVPQPHPTNGPQLSSISTLISTGRRLQRFWLTASSLGIAMQPLLAPLAFSHYANTNTPFTAKHPLMRYAQRSAGGLSELLKYRAHSQTDSTSAHGEPIFFARLGYPGRPTTARSVRFDIQTKLEPDDSRF